MAFLDWRGVGKRYGETPALQGVSLRLAEGDVLAVMGPSGCGKTTFLRVSAGLEKPDEGQILCQGEDLAGTPAHRRGFGLMFQDYGLFPHLDVAHNIAFGLRMKGVPRGERASRVKEMLRLVRLEDFPRRSVHELSGGERQRIALARSLAPSPRLLMLDEPLAALDATLRRRLLTELGAILREVGVTAIYVTHDSEEALALADRAAIMRNGRIVQAGRPRDLVQHPADSFVASFLELGAVLDARPARRNGRLFLATGIGLLPAALAQKDVFEGARLLVRPRAVSFRRREGWPRVKVMFVSRTPHPLGVAVRICLAGTSGTLQEMEVLCSSEDPGARISAGAGSEHAVWLDMDQCEIVKA